MLTNKYKADIKDKMINLINIFDSYQLVNYQ